MQTPEIIVISIAVTLLVGIIFLSFLKDTGSTLGTVIKFIILLCVVAVILYILFEIYERYNQAKKDSPVLVDHPISLPASGGAHALPASRIGNEYTISFWIYVSNWDINYGKPKHILSRKSVNHDGFNPGIWLYPNKSNLMIRVDTNKGNNNNYSMIPGCSSIPGNNMSGKVSTFYGSDPLACQTACNNQKNGECDRFILNRNNNTCALMRKQNPMTLVGPPDNTLTKNTDGICEAYESGYDAYIKTANGPDYENMSSQQLDPNDQCDVVDVGIQRWVHVAVVMWNRTLDVYKNGKLVRSCIIDGVVPNEGFKSKLIIGGKGPGAHEDDNISKGGSWGAISHVQYFNHALNAKQIYKRYRKGPNNWSLLQDFKNLFPKIDVSLNTTAN